MSRTRILAGVATAALAVGSFGTAAPAAAAADDSKVRTGSCSGQSNYRMTLTERGDDRLRATFFINGRRDNARWNVTFKREGNTVFRDAKRANNRGNVFFADTFRGDDDTVRVIARAAYGERCTSSIELDD